MRHSKLLILVFLTLAVLLPTAGCRGRSKDATAKTAKRESATTTTSTPAASAPAATPDVVICPECAGLGRSPHSGDYRPCFLCDGAGRCAVCQGRGHDPEGACAACDGSGECSDCQGDGEIGLATHDPGGLRSPIPGQCPLCIRGSGLCSECGGAGALADGRTCRVCAGERRCPECRGSGEHPLCRGSGVCPLCRGRGALIGDEPADREPALLVHLLDGSEVQATLLGAPSRMLRIEKRDGGKTEREAISLPAVEPNDVLLAYRLHASDAPARVRLDAARFSLATGDEFLLAARHDVRAARAAGAPETEVSLLLAKIESGRAEWFATEAGSRMEDDPQEAWVLLNLRLRGFPDRDGREALEARREQAAAQAASPDADLAPEVRERRAEARAGLQRRAVVCARAWQVRAEDLMSRTGATADHFLRAHRAAEDSWLLLARSANRADGEIAAALAEDAATARSLRVRALIGLAARLLDSGHVERARALGVVALSLSADDDGATRFLAEVEGALGRRAREKEER